MRLWVLLSVLSAYQAADVCSRDDFSFDSFQSRYMISRKVLFTPKSPLRPARMVMDESGTLDPRFRINSRTATVKILSVNKDYDGAYSVFWPGMNKTLHLVTLRVKDCPVYMMLEYGSSYSFEVYSLVEQIDYSTSDDGPITVILWNRTEAIERPRGTLENGRFVVKSLTQTDGGYYTLRDKEGHLLKKYRITIEALYRRLIFKTGEDFTISFPLDAVPFSLIYQAEMVSYPITLIKDGHLEDSERFEGRIELLSTGLEIMELEAHDSGTFKLIDSNRNQALVVELTVTRRGFADFGINYIALMGGVVVVIVICLCCAKRFCCRKRNSTTSIPVTQVYHHETTTNDQRQSQPYSMVINQSPSANKQPQASDILSPPSNNVIAGGGGDLGPSSEFATPAHVGPIHFQGSAAGGVDAPTVTLGFDCLSSDSGTQFEIPKGRNYPSAPLLSSDPPSYDVYTSDKFNFL